MSELPPPHTYDWYEVVEGSEVLQQGDLLPSVPVFNLISPEDAERGTAPITDIRDYNLVVMTQSCDLAFCKADMILLCPFFSLDSYIEGKMGGKNADEKTKEKNKLRKDELIGHHLLSSCDLPSFEFDYMVVDLKNPVSLPAEYLNAVLLRYPRRVRLLPPYREHLSQAFARTFMRVGLPKNIPQF